MFNISLYRLEEKTKHGNRRTTRQRIVRMLFKELPNMLTATSKTDHSHNNASNYQLISIAHSYCTK